MCDPNGPLLKGGSCEFLHVPVRELPAGVPPSTSVSRFDRDEQAKVEAAATGKGKGKKKGGKRKRP